MNIYTMQRTRTEKIIAWAYSVVLLASMAQSIKFLLKTNQAERVLDREIAATEAETAERIAGLPDDVQARFLAEEAEPAFLDDIIDMFSGAFHFRGDGDGLRDVTT